MLKECDKSFWYFAQSMAVLLPCSLQKNQKDLSNEKTITDNEILCNLKLRLILDWLYCPMHQKQLLAMHGTLRNETQLYSHIQIHYPWRQKESELWQLQSYCFNAIMNQFDLCQHLSKWQWYLDDIKYFLSAFWVNTFMPMTAWHSVIVCIVTIKSYSNHTDG